MALGPVIDLLNHDAAPSCEVVERDAGAGGGGAQAQVLLPLSPYRWKIGSRRADPRLLAD